MSRTTAPTRRDVLSAIARNREQIRALGVSRLALFGSVARDRASADSDVDLLVEFEPGLKTFDRFMQLAFLLEDVLGRRVELVTVEALSPYLKPYIMEEVEYVPLVA
jgi:predicted nucleotidyltransferase